MLQAATVAAIVENFHGQNHGLRTPNEGLNQICLKNWVDVAEKICFGHTLKFGIGIEFRRP